MATENELSSAFNFGIESTAMGNQELLDDVFSPETSSSKPEDITVIEDEPKKKDKPVEVKKEAPIEEEEDIDPLDMLKGDDDDDDEEEEDIPLKSNKPIEDEEKEEKEEESPVTNRFNALAKDLLKLGVFSQDDEEEDFNIASPQEFLERFEHEKKKGAIEVLDRFIAQHGEDYQSAFESIFVKGVNPREYFGTFEKIENFSNLDLADENNQTAVIKQALLDQGFEPEDITSEVERLKNYGDLETVAKKHHKVLIKKEAANLEKLEVESQNRLLQQNQIKQQYIANVNKVLEDKVKQKEFDGIPLNPKIATELQDFLITDRYKTPSGETLTEFDKSILDLKRPENHEKKVKVALLLKTLEKDPTLSSIKRKGITETTNELFGELARQTEKSSVKGKKKEAKANSWFV